MARGVRLFIVGSLVLVTLVGCGRWFAEREPWRHEAEVACLKSGAVKQGLAITQVAPISGPGVCGADFPLKVTMLGDSPALSFADQPRPPSDIPGLLSRMPPALMTAPETAERPGPARPSPREMDEGPRASPAPRASSSPQTLRAAGPAEIAPAATLACPIVSALDTWFANDVQPAAMRWFGQPIVAIKQISAYSCRGMNGQRGARISEHAFGNALDIAGFTLADGRMVTVREGWHGAPQEQGFLRDVHAAACTHFSTVLSPGSNAFHYDHLHVDLMRRGSGRTVCNPDPIAGEAVAARAAQRRSPYAQRETTGSIGRRGRDDAEPGED